MVVSDSMGRRQLDWKAEKAGDHDSVTQKLVGNMASGG